MNNVFKTFFYSSVTLHILLVLKEMSMCVSFLVRGDIGNNFLETLVEEKDFKSNLNASIYKQMRSCLFSLLRNGVYIFLIYLISNLEHKKEPKEVEDGREVGRVNEELLTDEMSTNDPCTNIDIENLVIEDESYVSRLFSYLNSEENILLFISYFYVISTFLPFLLSIKLIPVIIGAPYVYYKANMRLYIKYRYAKVFFFSVYMAMIFFACKVGSNIFRASTFDDGRSLPKEIHEYFLSRGVDLTVERVKSDSLNVGIFSFFNNVYILIFGDVGILNEKEQIAVFYHEIGHYEHNSLIYRLLVSKFISISLMILEILFLKFNRKIITEKVSKYGSWFLVFILLQMTCVPPMLAINNFYSQLDEYEADNFSSQKINPKYLASALSKLILYSKSYIDFTKMYSLFYRTHPSLLDRLKNLGVY